MSHVTKRAAALGLLWMVSCVLSAPRAMAQDSAAVFALEVQPDIVPVEALRAALQDELGVAFRDADTNTAGMPTVAVARGDDGHVEVSLRSRNVPRVSREVALTSPRPEERVETLALIAANMVRNEAASLLPDMQPRTLPPPAPTKKPPPAKLIDPCETGGDAIFGIDFAPGIGNSSTAAGRAAMRRMSLGFAGTLSSRLEGLEISLGVNIKTVSVCGAQLTYAANITHGPLTGMQFAVFNLATSRMVGAQGGTVNITGGDVHGAQGGTVNIAGGDVNGFQGAVLNIASGRVTGAQVAVTNVAAGALTGAQLSFANYAGGALGMQLGLANISSEQLEGLQLGLGNYAGDVDGAQLGLVNIAPGEVRGTQVGLVNYADESKASIGLLSIVRHGRTSIDFIGQADTGVLTAGFTHGSKYVHNSWGFGVREGKDGQRMVVTYGLGVRVLSTSLLRLDIDAIGSLFLTDHMGSSTTQTGGIRVPLTFMVFRGLGLMAAPGYQVMSTDDSRDRDPSVFGNTKIHSGATRVLGYPTLTFGVRYEFDHGT